jgi:hypothetical protein
VEQTEGKEKREERENQIYRWERHKGRVRAGEIEGKERVEKYRER